MATGEPICRARCPTAEAPATLRRGRYAAKGCADGGVRCLAGRVALTAHSQGREVAVCFITGCSAAVPPMAEEASSFGRRGGRFGTGEGRAKACMSLISKTATCLRGFLTSRGAAAIGSRLPKEGAAKTPAMAISGTGAAAIADCLPAIISTACAIGRRTRQRHVYATTCFDEVVATPIRGGGRSEGSPSEVAIRQPTAT